MTISKGEAEESRPVALEVARAYRPWKPRGRVRCLPAPRVACRCSPVGFDRQQGFNAILKNYVNPNIFVLRFVKQYQKIQDKCLVAWDRQDFRTNDRERSRWSKYPIEKHASTMYTKNLFYIFSKEFEKTAEYDLVPNNKSVYGYGKWTYLVTAIEDEGSYYCECSRFDRDGVICCHIMQIMTRLGVETIPNRFILKRWTQEAVRENENGNANAHVQADFITCGIPLNNRKTLWFTNLSTAFAGLAVEGCNPPRLKVKGRKKEKRLKKGMNAEAKRKNKFSICKSIDHNAARCPERGGGVWSQGVSEL
ncbi:hypothetical protein GQ55_2G137400 [Panicum hallii var. hallii]|uniref:SWIM-type domain-containing protein n=1 Tax=Panicum hallii var. hallii TaxID=1504633 RepID=A0A2T7EPK5_9POAL|nr:hypothetical protein GQ55_2G137400 [Panicum hallii var. hallii]